MRKTSAVHNAQRHSFTSGPVCGPLLDLHCFPFGPGLDAFHWTCVGFIALTSGPLCFIAPTSGPVWADSFSLLDLGGDDAFDFWACVGLVPHFWTCMDFRLDAFHWTCVGFIALTSGPLCFIAPTSGPVWADSGPGWG